MMHFCCCLRSHFLSPTLSLSLSLFHTHIHTLSFSLYSSTFSLSRSLIICHSLYALCPYFFLHSLRNLCTHAHTLALTNLLSLCVCLSFLWLYDSFTRAHTHTYPPTHTYTYTHIHIHIHIHTHATPFFTPRRSLRKSNIKGTESSRCLSSIASVVFSLFCVSLWSILFSTIFCQKKK